MADLTIRVEGAEQASVDARALLKLASALVDLIAQVADHNRLHLAFEGLSLEGGSVRARIGTTQDEPTLLSLVHHSEQFVNDAVPIPSKLRSTVNAFRSAIRQTPANWKIQAASGKLDSVELPRPRVTAIESHARERVELRGVVVRVGGKNAATALLDCPAERGVLTLGVDKSLAEKLGRHLYQEVGFEALVTRDWQLRVKEGRLLDFHALHAEGAWDAWLEWGKSNAAALGEAVEERGE